MTYETILRKIEALKIIKEHPELFNVEEIIEIIEILSKQLEI